eukprot:CAMPEP_0185744792 /NCGR_PEP_ID=MMETSP1174-20130828/2992_1 /TAXON_ID=35687 /ORGANISM="Dictyocha speculum, Strain CCMP1381" /LENGTH=226 /DNA_ID=CAMNT_0028418415 /DNA_START=34 /DNA_END=714 /DNA_ORIENTATION=-
MGAGASISDDKMSLFKEKLLNLDKMSQSQKNKLLDEMANEVKKLQPPPSEKPSEAEQRSAAVLQAKTRQRNTKPASAPGNMGGESLQEVFESFCKTYRQTAMTNVVWAKFCKDAKLFNAKFKKPDVDMVWSKVAGKEKKLDFPKFQGLLAGVAAKKGIPAEEVEAHVLSNAKVSSSGTKGESRFYDDKSQWTGAAKNGGCTSKDDRQTLQGLSNRDNKANVRGVIQ